MPNNRVSRRLVITAIAGGALVAPLARLTKGTRVRGLSVLSPAKPANVPAHAEIVRPLVPGARFGRWTLDDVQPPLRGAMTVVAHGDDGEAFRLEILARDGGPLAAAPPAETDRFAIFVCNRGDGSTATAEEQGLAAMTLATFVRANEQRIDATAFLTHADRIAQYKSALLEHRDEPSVPVSRA